MIVLSRDDAIQTLRPCIDWGCISNEARIVEYRWFLERRQSQHCLDFVVEDTAALLGEMEMEFHMCEAGVYEAVEREEWCEMLRLSRYARSGYFGFRSSLREMLALALTCECGVELLGGEERRTGVCIFCA